MYLLPIANVGQTNENKWRVSKHAMAVHGVGVKGGGVQLKGFLLLFWLPFR